MGQVCINGKITIICLTVLHHHGKKFGWNAEIKRCNGKIWLCNDNVCVEKIWADIKLFFHWKIIAVVGKKENLLLHPHSETRVDMAETHGHLVVSRYLYYPTTLSDHGSYLCSCLLIWYYWWCHHHSQPIDEGQLDSWKDLWSLRW